jgi:very-short-patch-repair endonuclease
VDLGHRQAQVALEAEGYEFHGSSSAFAADCQRYDELVAAGWLVLRFTYQQIVFEPAWVVDMVREALSRPTGHSAQMAGANLVGERDEPVDW